MSSKIHAFMRPLTLPFLIVLACALGPGAVLAEKADRSKPMNVEADALKYDDLKQISVFTGKVVITKGSIVIRGARVEVRQDGDGYQFGTVTSEPGRLAYYKQKREGLDEFIEGEAEVIEYDGRADRVRFVRSAQMRRLRGATLADEMSGSLIVYDNSNDTFTVDGGESPSGSVTPAGRVRAVLTPRSAASAPASGQAAPALRPSATMGGERK